MDTATRLRERPAVQEAESAAGSGIQEKAGGTVISLPQRAPLPTTATLAAPAAVPAPKRGPSTWVAVGIVVLGMSIAAFAALRTSPPGPSNAAARPRVSEPQVATHAAPATQAAVPASVGPVQTPEQPQPRSALPASPNRVADTAPVEAATPVEESTRPRSRATEAGELSPTERTAWLDVKVTPNDRAWQVWVDGQYYGAADVKVKVPPGKHSVEVGTDRPTHKRAVRVPARATREVAFEL